MDYFKKWNRIAGWGVFAVSALVYLMTIEPAASLWDCAEFIATSYKLEVGHPPGAPLWMMIARVFAMLAPSPQHVGLMVNAMSALCGAFTVLFLFWSITHLARKVRKDDTWAVIGAGAIGALAYCFTDTQWFSAVEGEVYSMSSMVTAMVFWCILQWEDAFDKPYATRWLVLIAYMMGLSIGVHILNLLCIPAIVLVYYFRTSPKVKGWGVVKALAVAGAILVAINWIIMPYTIRIGAAFDRMFVNGFGLPVNSGLIFWAAMVAALCVAGLWWTRSKKTAHTVVLCFTFIMLGYSSYASMIIRAAGDPPMNSNDPSNPFMVMSVIDREQYGSTPLLKGPSYASPIENNSYKKATYLGEDGKYHSVEVASANEYPPQFEYFFPRLWRRDRAELYKAWANIEGRPEVWNGERIMVPTAADNLRFFFSYQLNYMYWRYFLWNFVGRQNDVQGDGGLLYGNWLSGIKFIDSAYLGPQDNIPSEMKENKARNTYFFLPFILGIVGLLWQLKRDKRNFAVVTMLFFMMGIALVLYFNTAPAEPRERDYVYAGSFYAFSIWIGLGVMAVVEWLEKKKVCRMAATVGAVTVCASVPAVLCAQNWDDHDRSHRYTMPAIGFNALSNTLPNSIVMDYGDNDTFPLWYMQEVEDVRPDVRIMNMSYLQADWYVTQMTHKYNESEPVPFSLPPHKYIRANDLIPVLERTESAVPLRELIDFVGSDDRGTQRQVYVDDGWYDYIPTRHTYIPVNKEKAVASGIVRAEDAHLMVDSIPITIRQDVVEKSDLMLLDLLATFDWERPLYFVFLSSLRDLGLTDYLQFDGWGYRLVPIYSPGRPRVDVDHLWHNVMELDRYGNVKDPRVYADYFTNYHFDVFDARYGFARLAEELIDTGDSVRAVEALDRSTQELPFSQIKHSDSQTIPVIQAYYDLGEMEKGNAIMDDYSRVLREYIMYFVSFRGNKANLVMGPLSDKLRSLQHLYRLAMGYGQTEQAAPMEEIFDMFEI